MDVLVRYVRDSLSLSQREKENYINTVLTVVKWLNIYKKYTLADSIAYNLIHNIRIPDMPVFRIDRSILYSQLIEHKKNQPLLIAFSAFTSKIVDSHYSKHKIDNLELLHGSGRFPVLSFFADSHKFNVLHILDEYQVWGLFNFSKYFMHIKQIINSICPSKIITFGASAGGFSSLLYGVLLNADLAIACSPQTIAFYDYMNEYRKDINKKYFISLDQYCYINRIFDCYNNKTIKSIYYSSENKKDKYHCDLVRGIDNLTFFNEFKAGNNHNLFSVYGKEFMYSKIMNDINKFCGL